MRFRCFKHFRFPSNRVRENCVPCAYLVRTGVRQGGHMKRKPAASKERFDGSTKCVCAAHPGTAGSASPANAGDRACLPTVVRNTRWKGCVTSAQERRTAGGLHALRCGKARKLVTSRATLCGVNARRQALPETRQRSAQRLRPARPLGANRLCRGGEWRCVSVKALRA